MTEEMKKYLLQLLSRVEGLYCILVSDRDGVPVLKVILRLVDMDVYASLLSAGLEILPLTVCRLGYQPRGRLRPQIAPPKFVTAETNGTAVMRHMRQDEEWVATDKAPELAMRPSFLSTFAMATDQGGKLGLGKHKSLICMYSSYQVVQINKLPLVVSFVASEWCNTGHILSLEQHIEPLLGDLKGAVVES